MVEPGTSSKPPWPLPLQSRAHPRSAGCYSKILRWLVRDLEAITLEEAIPRPTLLPASLLEAAVPAMSRKGRLQPGADADLIVFDPSRVTDHATYRELAPSSGFDHVLVGGVAVVKGGELKPEQNPGQTILAT